MTKILFIFGTRPETIKLAPLIKEFQNERDVFDVKICITSQHREMLKQVMDFFQITPDFNLNIMKHNQSIFDITSESLKRLNNVLEKSKPDIIFVQGDTTTAFVGALAGFYRKVKVAHVEAGLRSFNKFAPFPEEINRVLISHIADYHFAPTKKAKQNLIKEGIKNSIYVVGNTVIDALQLGLKLIENNEEKYKKYFKFLNFNKKIILVTGHRRESFGEGFKNICDALKEIALKYKDTIEIIYPVHLNPNIQKSIKKIFYKMKNIHLLKPLNYPHLLYLMKNCWLILTDSGGIQEEAPSLGKPVLVMREVTERIEGIKKGTSILVGTDRSRIVKEVQRMLYNHRRYIKMARIKNPYGDGSASYKIKKIILKSVRKIF